MSLCHYDKTSKLSRHNSSKNCAYGGRGKGEGEWQGKGGMGEGGGGRGGGEGEGEGVHKCRHLPNRKKHIKGGQFKSI